MKKDIICGMDVKEDSKFTTLHGGRKMYFCSKDCQQRFIHEPEKYLRGDAAKTQKAA